MLKRILGINIYETIQNSNIDIEKMATYLKYSVRDIHRIMEGKIFLPPFEVEKIAKFLGTTKYFLLNNKTKNPVPYSNNIREFSKKDNLDKILDLIDEYIDLKENIVT